MLHEGLALFASDEAGESGGAAGQSAIQNCTMTGSPLRRLQELAVVLHGGLAVFASDEGGESGGLPVRVQSKFVMKSKARIGHSIGTP